MSHKTLELFTYSIGSETPHLIGGKVSREPGQVVLSAGIRGRRGACLIVRTRRFAR